MNKTNLTNWLSALCAILLVVLLVIQSKQKTQFDLLRQQHGAFVSATTQRQQEAHDAAAKLADQLTNLGANLESAATMRQQEAHNAVAKLSDRVLSLGTNWEAELTPRLNAKSDEIVAAFSKRLNEKTAEAVAQTAQQIENNLSKVAAERSNKTAHLLDAANRYEKDSRPELAELCYLSAFQMSEGNAGLVMKQFLAWKERSFAAMTEINVLTSSPAKLMSLYETLDKVLPDSSASPEEMENALSTADRISNQIVERQQAKMNEISNSLSWVEFAATNLTNYVQLKDALVSFSPANANLEKEKTDLQEAAENLIQTATAMSSLSVADLLPPSPKAPVQVLTNWFDRGLALIAIPTNTVEARLAGLSVLVDFAHNQSERSECHRYAEVLTNESVKLACAQWAERVDKYGEMAGKKDKPDADTLAVGQSLLNQGLAILKSFTNKTTTADVNAFLPGLASKLYLQREMLLVGQMRLVNAPDTFSSKEQAARARSMLYGQMMSTVFDLRALQSEIAKECAATPDALATLKDIEGRFREYLATYEKLDKADVEDAKGDQLAKLRQQYQRYANHCKQNIEDARSDYDDAKEIADEFFRTWSNDDAQANLRSGLEKLYSIDINDLNRADPGLANKWSTVEDLLKKNFKGTPSSINAQTRKKSLNDF